ncbi:hypothetical protein K2X33_15375 [bacterium]|nr:hypothetical protein [bacterium]
MRAFFLSALLLASSPIYPMNRNGTIIVFTQIEPCAVALAVLTEKTRVNSGEFTTMIADLAQGAETREVRIVASNRDRFPPLVVWNTQIEVSTGEEADAQIPQGWRLPTEKELLLLAETGVGEFSSYAPPHQNTTAGYRGAWGMQPQDGRNTIGFWGLQLQKAAPPATGFEAAPSVLLNRTDETGMSEHFHPGEAAGLPRFKLVLVYNHR